MVFINFGKSKISMLGFDSEDDFLEFRAKCEFLFRSSGGKFPIFYIIKDPEAKEEDVTKIRRFIEEMKRMQVDLETIKRNLDAGRFPDITGHREKPWWDREKD